MPHHSYIRDDLKNEVHGREDSELHHKLLFQSYLWQELVDLLSLVGLHLTFDVLPTSAAVDLQHSQ